MKVKITLIILCFSWQLAYAQQFERYKNSFDTTFVSSKLAYQKKLNITFPSEFQIDNKSEGYPLIIIFDSQNPRSYAYILNTIDYLTSNEQMPSSVVIGVESDVQNRYGETQLEISDSNAFGSKNEQFIIDELIPFAKQNFQTLNYCLLIGHSRYGYFTSYLFSKNHPEINAVISASPVFSQKNSDILKPIIEISSSYNKSNFKYLRFGIGNDYPEDFQRMNAALNNRKNQSENVSIEGYLFKDADHNVTPGLTAGRALYEVFEFWSNQQNNFIRSKGNLKSDFALAQENINMHYGADLKLALGILNGKGWEYYNNQDYEQAAAAWDMTFKNYPSFSDALLFKMYALKEMQKDYMKTRHDFLESLKLSEMYSDEEKAELIRELAEEFPAANQH